MAEAHIKRCDVRVPIELYKEIETIAVEEYNAPTYKKTGRPQVSQTILELVRLGIDNLRNDISDNSSDKTSDISSDNIKSLINEKLQTAIATQLSSQLDGKIAAATKPLITEIEQLKKHSPLLRTSLA